MPTTLIVNGFEELQKSLRLSGPAVQKAMNDGLKAGAEPVRALAGLYARERISGMKRARRTPAPWSIMRVGVTTRSVYVAPVERGLKGPFDLPGRRPNLFNLLLEKALYPASDAGAPLVAQAVEVLIDEAIAAGF